MSNESNKDFVLDLAIVAAFQMAQGAVLRLSRARKLEILMKLAEIFGPSLPFAAVVTQQKEPTGE